jgi:8-amino-7-oxononanoate synthase
MNRIPKKLSQRLEERRSRGGIRKLSLQGELVDFSSNDYLGFATDPPPLEMKEPKGHWGATGSRLLTGHHQAYKELEERLAKFYRASEALVFNSGYDANMGLLSALPQKGDLVLYDQLSHTSIREGLRLSEAKTFKFPHNDLQALEELAKRWKDKVEGDRYLVTESVFSMDGDSPDLKAMARWCEKNNFYWILDEAHGTFAGQGRGMAVERGIEEFVFARLVTFGKAIGGHGACVLGSEELKDYLINFARPLIYTTALPPGQLRFLEAIHQVREGQEGEERAKTLADRISYFREGVHQRHLDSLVSTNASPIQWVSTPGEDAVLALAERYRVEGFDIRAIRPPTVPQGRERLRICLHAFNTEEQIDQILSILVEA